MVLGPDVGAGEVAFAICCRCKVVFSAVFDPGSGSWNSMEWSMEFLFTPFDVSELIEVPWCKVPPGHFGGQVLEWFPPPGLIRVVVIVFVVVVKVVIVVVVVVIGTFVVVLLVKSLQDQGVVNCL